MNHGKIVDYKLILDAVKKSVDHRKYVPILAYATF